MNFRKKTGSLLSLLLTLLLFILPVSGCGSAYTSGESGTTESAVTSDYTDSQTDTKSQDAGSSDTASEQTAEKLDPNGSYTSKTDVMNYLIQYGTLPDNFITKKEAKKLGWSGGSLEDYAPGKCIGGDYFGNYEEVLPVVSGRTYHECDIDTLGAKSRGAKRIVYSDEGQIYYTEDHYETFTLIYGEE